MPFSVISLMAEKARSQIENIVDKESNEEIASSKDETDPYSDNISMFPIIADLL
jgi:hypothetical protein